MALCVILCVSTHGLLGYDFWSFCRAMDRGKWSSPAATLFGDEPTPWIAHSWLCQAFFYTLLQLGRWLGAVKTTFSGNRAAHCSIVHYVRVRAVFTILWRLWKLQQCPVAFWTPVIFAIAIWSSAHAFGLDALSAFLLQSCFSFLIERCHDLNGTRGLQQGSRRKVIGVL